MNKKTKILSILIGLVILGAPVIAYSQTETHSFSDSPLFHTRTTMAAGENTNQFQTQYLGQNYHTIVIPRIIKTLEQKGIILNSSICTTKWKTCVYD